MQECRVSELMHLIACPVDASQATSRMQQTQSLEPWILAENAAKLVVGRVELTDRPDMKIPNRARARCS